MHGSTEASQAKPNTSTSHMNKKLVPFTLNTLLSWLLKHHFAVLFLVPSCLFAKCNTYLEEVKKQKQNTTNNQPNKPTQRKGEDK